jgi:hypothetical protein
MKKSATANLSPPATTPSENFTPSREQIETISRRLVPEIKKFLADELTQNEFAKWKEKKVAEK